MMTSAYRDPSAHLTCGFHKHKQSNFFSSMNIGLIHTFYWRHQGLGRECYEYLQYIFFSEDEMSFKYKRYISETAWLCQCECLKNKCESRSAKNFSVRATQQMVCMCDFPLVFFLEDFKFLSSV